MQQSKLNTTGTNTGIGKETAADLYKRGATVIMLCRSEQKANAAINSINDEVGDSNGTLTFEQCDMSSMLSVKKCAERHGCQMAIARFLDRMCFALRAS